MWLSQPKTRGVWTTSVGVVQAPIIMTSKLACYVIHDKYAQTYNKICIKFDTFSTPKAIQYIWGNEKCGLLNVGHNAYLTQIPRKTCGTHSQCY